VEATTTSDSIVARFTIAPPPALAITGAIACVTRYMPFRFVSRTRSHSSSLSSSSGDIRTRPALLTR
jgi:hypothetical protein